MCVKFSANFCNQHPSSQEPQKNIEPIRELAFCQAQLFPFHPGVRKKKKSHFLSLFITFNSKQPSVIARSFISSSQRARRPSPGKHQADTSWPPGCCHLLSGCWGSRGSCLSWSRHIFATHPLTSSASRGLGSLLCSPPNRTASGPSAAPSAAATRLAANSRQETGSPVRSKACGWGCQPPASWEVSRGWHYALRSKEDFFP